MGESARLGLYRVLPPLSVGEMTLRLYAAGASAIECCYAAFECECQLACLCRRTP